MVVHRGVAAADRGQADLNQRQADDHHHDAGNQRGDDAARQMQHARQQNFGAGGDHQGAEQRGHHGRHVGAAVFQRQATHDQWRNEVEAGALNRQQPGAHRPPGFDLQNGSQTGSEQRHADDVLGILRRQTQRLADQQRRSDHRNEHRQQVLAGGKQRLWQRRAVFEAINQFAGAGFRGGLACGIKLGG